MQDEWKLEIKLVFAFCSVFILGVLYFYGVGRVRSQEQYIASKVSLVENSFKDYTPNAKSVYVYAPESDYILFAHHEYTPLPLASLTKIMTATVALEKMDPTEKITIDEESKKIYGDNGLVLNETWQLYDLIKFMMFVSSNDGAHAIANFYDTHYVSNDPLNKSTFVTEMNYLAQSFLMSSLSFSNPSGLDEEESVGGVGNARDIANLYYKLYVEHPEIVKDSSVFKQTYTSIDGVVHTPLNTNILLETDNNNIIGSKTGYTSKAGGNLIVLLHTELEEPIVLVVLGSTIDGRFEEMKTLLENTRRFSNSLYSLGLSIKNLK